MSGTPRDLFPELYGASTPPTIKSPYAPSASDAASVQSSGTAKSTSLAKKLWCDTQWTALSLQAKDLGLATLPYFDPKTMLLSKEVNVKLWKQLEKLYSALGPEKAALATPKMIEGGEVKWHSFMGEDKGTEAEIYNK